MEPKREGIKQNFEPLPSHTEDIARLILDAAYQVHTALGPGLLESVYETCLAHELIIKKVEVKTQIILPVFYKGIEIDTGYRLDMLVDDIVIVEIKSAEAMNPIYGSQLLTYLKLTKKRLGLLINFNVVHLRDGIKWVIN